MDRSEMIGSYRLYLKSKVMLALVRPLALISVAFLWRLEIVWPPNYLFSCFRDSRWCLFGSAAVLAHVTNAIFLNTVFWPVLLDFLRGAVQLVRTTLHPTRLRFVLELQLVLVLWTQSGRFWTAVSY